MFKRHWKNFPSSFMNSMKKGRSQRASPPWRVYLPAYLAWQFCLSVVSTFTLVPVRFVLQCKVFPRLLLSAWPWALWERGYGEELVVSRR
jgi:hypothetical protein